MKMLKSKKVLLSLVCALVLVFGSCITVCAESDSLLDSIEQVFANEGYTDVQYFWSGFYNDDGTISVYFVKGADFYFVEYGEIAKLYVKGYLYHATCDIENGCFTTDVRCWDYRDSYMISGNYNIETFVSNKECYWQDGTLFFRPLSPIAMIAETVGMERTLGQILGLLPLLIPLVVGLVALRKGLAMLFNRLRQA